MLTVYAYEKCSTCRTALAWLRSHAIPHVVKPIREQPPTPAELTRMLTSYGGDVRRLFNTSGTDYRAMKLSAALPTMSTSDAIALLSRHGNLVKRPFLISPRGGLVGFDTAAWSALLG